MGGYYNFDFVVGILKADGDRFHWELVQSAASTSKARSNEKGLDNFNITETTSKSSSTSEPSQTSLCIPSLPIFFAHPFGIFGLNKTKGTSIKFFKDGVKEDVKGVVIVLFEF